MTETVSHKNWSTENDWIISTGINLTHSLYSTVTALDQESKLHANRDYTNESSLASNYFAVSSIKTKQEARWVKIVSTEKGQVEDD